MPHGTWTQKHSRDTLISDAGIIGYRGLNLPEDALWYHHMPASRIKEEIGEEIWENYFKFCVIRDPFDKAVSAFYFFKKFRENTKPQSQQNPLKQRILRFFKPETKFKNISEEFEYWLDSGAMIIDRDKYMIDEKFCLDEVIRYESLHEGIKNVCKRLDLEFDATLLPSFKKGIRDDKMSISEIYSQKSIDIISNIFAYEIETFGYKPPTLK